MCSRRSRINGTSPFSSKLRRAQLSRLGMWGKRALTSWCHSTMAKGCCHPMTPAALPPCTTNSPYFAKNLDLYSVLGNPALTDSNGNLLSADNNGINEGATISGTKSNGNMEYNSLQAVLQKEMSHGLQGQLSYTYSKCMSDSTGYYGAWNNALSASAYWQNVYDQRSEWAPCYYDATHVLSAYAVYQLPFGHGKQFASGVNKSVDEVIGGWAVSPIVSFRTGWPMPIYGASDNSGTFSRGARADCNSLPSIENTRDPRNRHPVVHQQQQLHSTGSWYFRGLLTAALRPAIAALHRCRRERAQGFLNNRTVPIAIPHRLHQRLQPRSIQRSEHNESDQRWGRLPALNHRETSRWH